MKLLVLFAVFAVLAGTAWGKPLSDSKAEPTEPPVPKKPSGDVHAKQEPKDEEPTPGTFQGDMMLTEDQQRDILDAIDEEKTGRKKRKATSSDTRWEGNIVPYEITDSSSGDSDVIRAAMDHWESLTCLRFEPKTSSHASQLGHNTYLSFIKGGGCWSYVGRVFGSAQQISIGNGCASLGIVAHEIGHAMGFHHEQSRPERDDFITVHYENIQDGRESQFEKYSVSQITDLGVEYDIGSVMHYGSHGFSKNGLPTITTNDPLQMSRLGNRDGLSFADVKLTNLLYQCNSGCDNDVSCVNGGYQGPSCSCVCPPGFSGDSCENGDGPGEPEGCNQRLTASEGEIMSPNYPSQYENDQDCMYLIEGPPGSTITLTFEDLNIESHASCAYDYVEVRSDDVSVLGERFCGTNLPAVQVSSGNELLVAFHSDYSVTRRGFKASYVISGGTEPTTEPTTVSTTEPSTAPTTTRPTEPPTEPPTVVGTCGGDFTGSSGSMATPNYPSNYDNNLVCEYVIEVEAGRRVELSIEDLAIEGHSSCGWDALTVDLGDGINVPMRICGDVFPSGSLVSVNNRMVLTLRTDSSVVARGFVAHYNAIEL